MFQQGCWHHCAQLGDNNFSHNETVSFECHIAEIVFKKNPHTYQTVPDVSHISFPRDGFVHFLTGSPPSYIKDHICIFEYFIPPPNHLHNLTVLLNWRTTEGGWIIHVRGQSYIRGWYCRVAPTENYFNNFILKTKTTRKKRMEIAIRISNPWTAISILWNGNMLGVQWVQINMVWFVKIKLHGV